MREIKGYVFTSFGRLVPGSVTIEDHVIVDIRELDKSQLTDRECERLILPGLVDIHSHGCFGHDTCDGDEEGLREMLRFEHSQGITTYFPTTMTFHEDRLNEVVKVIAKVAKDSPMIKGIYLEGPFISREKCGAQNPDYIMRPDFDMLERLNKTADGLIRIVAIAPEVDGAMECIVKGRSKYCFSIAHTNADYDTAVAAIDRGARHVTHFYNAMPAYNHRNPGVIGAAMDSVDVKVELISDGIHIHPAVVRNTFRTFGADRVILISDSMEATGMQDGKYSLGGQDVIVKGRLATLNDGTIAGSASTLMDCVREAVRMGVPLKDAVISATATPAKEVDLYDRIGSIEIGKDADLVLTDRNLNILEVI